MEEIDIKICQKKRKKDWISTKKIIVKLIKLESIIFGKTIYQIYEFNNLWLKT